MYSFTNSPPFIKLMFMSTSTGIYILITDFFPKGERARNILACYFGREIDMLSCIMWLLFAYKLLHRYNQERYLQIIIMKIKILWKYNIHGFLVWLIYVRIEIEACAERKRKEKLYIMTGHNMRWIDLFSVNHCLILL